MSTHTLCKHFESMGARLKVLTINHTDLRWHLVYINRELAGRAEVSFLD